MVGGLTRRALLARGAAGVVLAGVAGCGGTAGGRPAPTAARADLVLLRRACQSEAESTFLYGEVAAPREADRRLVRAIAAAEERHLTALETAVRRLGGEPGDYGGFAYADAPLEDALADERRSFRVHSELLPRIRTPAVRTLLGYVLAEEVAHAAALRDALGRDQATRAFLL